MKIQINTDDNLQGPEGVSEKISTSVENALRRFKDDITRIEVHLSDVNAGKSGQRDKRCMVEARLEGRQPVAATALAPTIPQAVQAAANKLVSLLETQIGRASRTQRTPTPLSED